MNATEVTRPQEPTARANPLPILRRRLRLRGT